ncbi:homoserine kinase [Compostibacter hankyongensis]|uniref:Homoserine kinase n=1 Tax=Compostibacter hankyongensis TaxID=1007089 RepID=A0ABP8FIZ6_9BACT
MGDDCCKSVKVFAPATVANVVCGFDVLGFAVYAPGDEVIMRLTDEAGVKIKAIHGDEGKLPLDPAKNTVSAAVIDYLQAIGEPERGVEITLFKKMPVGSGLGSSAASTVAGLFAINTLLEERLPREALLPFAMAGEQLACGQGHADNVAPALMGGFVLIRSYDPLDVIRLHTPPGLVCALIHPHLEVATRDARRIIRQQVSLKDAVQQWGNIAGLVSGLYREDHALISRSLQDVIIEPVRSMLIPDFYTLKQKALDQGALGFGISGSGPAVFALSTDQDTACSIRDAVQEHLRTLGIESDGYVSQVNAEGPRIM